MKLSIPISLSGERRIAISGHVPEAALNDAQQQARATKTSAAGYPSNWHHGPGFKFRRTIAEESLRRAEAQRRQIDASDAPAPTAGATSEVRPELNFFLPDISRYVRPHTPQSNRNAEQSAEQSAERPETGVSRVQVQLPVTNFQPEQQSSHEEPLGGRFLSLPLPTGNRLIVSGHVPGFALNEQQQQDREAKRSAPGYPINWHNGPGVKFRTLVLTDTQRRIRNAVREERRNPAADVVTLNHREGSTEERSRTLRDLMSRINLPLRNRGRQQVPPAGDIQGAGAQVRMTSFPTSDAVQLPRDPALPDILQTASAPGQPVTSPDHTGIGGAYARLISSPLSGPLRPPPVSAQPSTFEASSASGQPVTSLLETDSSHYPLPSLVSVAPTDSTVSNQSTLGP